MSRAISLKNIYRDEHKDILLKNSAQNEVYIMGVDFEDCALETNINEIVAKSRGNQGASLAYCGNGIGYFTTEVYLGSETRTSFMFVNKNY